MFKTHYDHMRPGPTPERVLAICKAVAAQPCTQDEIRGRIYLELGVNSKPGEEFRNSILAAEELGMIELKDGVYTLAVNPAHIATSEAFRRIAAKHAFANKESTFFNVSKWYVSNNEHVLFSGNWEDRAALANQSGIDKITDNDMLGWRFWASFLGLGYISGKELIPNMYVRVRDILATDFAASFPFDEEIPAAEFMRWLWHRLPEAVMEDRSINMALSNALRTLRDMGEVIPTTQMDAINMYLYSIPEDPTNKVTHFIVKEAVCK